MAHEQEWIYLKDEKPPVGAWVRVRGWHEISAKYQPGNEECDWEQDDEAPQEGNAVQWRPLQKGERNEHSVGE
jgi:hypothetical protein